MVVTKRARTHDAGRGRRGVSLGRSRPPVPAPVERRWRIRKPGSCGRSLRKLCCCWVSDFFQDRRLHTGRRGVVASRSKSGIVNVYGTGASSWRKSDRPKPLKAIGNLTTSILVARFNHDSQLLAIASKTQKDQMRLVCMARTTPLILCLYVGLRRNLQIHIPSLTAFSNWPTSGTPLGHVTGVDFSAGGEYVAIGNTRGRVLLYHLRDYDAHGGS
jgi:U3 small nucleolar RNA-associated protein 18